MKRSIILSLILTLSILLNSCGVMFGGSRYYATVVAKDNPNAEIYINGSKAGVGTASGSFKRNRPLKVELKENNKTTQSESFDYTFRTGNFILSLVTWGILGIGLDLGTGASYKPDHRFDDAIEKKSDKEFTFTIENDQNANSSDPADSTEN